MKDKSKRLRPAVIWLGAVALVIVGVATYVLLQRLSDETLAVLATVACAWCSHGRIARCGCASGYTIK